MNLDGMKINWTTWSKEDPRNLKKLVNNLQIILVSCKSSNENLPVIVNWNGVAEARLFGHVQDLFQYAFGAVYTGALSIQTGKWDWASCHFGSLDQVSTRWTRFVFLLDWLMSFNWKKPGKKLAWPWFTHFQGSDLDVFAIAGCSDRKDSWHLKPDEWESEGGKGVKGLTGIPKMRYYRMEMESLASGNFVGRKISMPFGFDVSQNFFTGARSCEEGFAALAAQNQSSEWAESVPWTSHFIRVPLSWKLAWLCIFVSSKEYVVLQKMLTFATFPHGFIISLGFSEAHVGFLRRCLELRRIAIRSEGSLGIEIPSQYFIGRTASGHDRLELEGVIVLHVKQGVIWEMFEVFLELCFWVFFFLLVSLQ